MVNNRLLNRAQKREDRDPFLNAQSPNMEAETLGLLRDAPETQYIEVVPENALVPTGDGAYTYKRFTMTPTGMDIPEDVTDDELNDVGEFILGLNQSISWVIGDWAAKANALWKVSYKQIADVFGYQEDTIKTYASLCRAIPRLIRNQRLEFGHHRLVAKLPEGEQRRWLERAALGDDGKSWTVPEMRRVMGIDSGKIPPTPPRLSAEVIEAQPRVHKHFSRFENFVKGSLHLSAGDRQQEGKAIIEWVQRVMEVGE